MVNTKRMDKAKYIAPILLPPHYTHSTRHVPTSATVHIEVVCHQVARSKVTLIGMSYTLSICFDFQLLFLYFHNPRAENNFFLAIKVDINFL